MATVQTGIATDLITFSRTSNATLTDSDGKIKWAPHNLLLASEQFDSASWDKTSSGNNITISPNATTSPNGTSTADLAYPTASGSFCYTFQMPNQTGIFSISVYAKASGKNVFWLYLRNSADGGVAYFDLSDQTTQVVAGSVSTFTATISSAGSGWYKLTATASASLDVTGIYGAGVGICDAKGSLSVTKSGSDGIYIWGAHLYRSDLGGMKANTSAYPMYNPTTPKNLLGFTESLTTGWTNTNTTDAIVSEVNPVGLTGAVDVAATAGNGTLLGSVSLLASPYTFSIYLKRKTGAGTVEITVDGTTYVAAAVTGTWTRFSTTLTPSAGTKTPGIRLVTSGDAVYAWGAQLSDSASLDTYVPNYGAAPTAAAYYGPRLDADPVTLAQRGLLVEEQRTNLSLYSSDFTQAAYWVKSYATSTNPVVTADQSTAPDGTVTADQVDFGAIDAAGDYSVLASEFTAEAAAYAGSVYVKAVASGDVGKKIWAYCYDTAIRGFVSATLTTSWQRLVSVGTLTSGTSRALYIGTLGSTFGGENQAAVSVYLWGGQTEKGSFATSIIPTSASTATRDADVASVSTQAFPYSSTAGSWVVYASFQQTTGAIATVLNDGNIAISASPATATESTMRVYKGTAPPVNLVNGANVTSGTLFKYGAGYITGTNASGFVSGSTINAFTNPDLVSTVVYLGDGTGLGAYGFRSLNGHIRQITYLPRRLTNTELQTRTS